MLGGISSLYEISIYILYIQIENKKKIEFYTVYNNSAQNIQII